LLELFDARWGESAVSDDLRTLQRSHCGNRGRQIVKQRANPAGVFAS